MVAVAMYGLLVFVAVAVWCWYHPANQRTQRRLQRTVVLGSLAIVLTLVFEQIASALLWRGRPFTTLTDLTAYNVMVDSSSFPSLHTAIAVAFAAIWLWQGYRRVGTWLMVWALLVGLARIMTGVHYPTDIIGGAVSGLVAAWVVWREASWLRHWLPEGEKR